MKPTLVLCLKNYDFDLLRRNAPGREYRRILRIEQVLGMRETTFFRLPGSEAVLGFHENHALWSYAQTHEINLCRISRERLETPTLAEWMRVQEQRHAQKFSPPALGEMCLCQPCHVSTDALDGSPICSNCKRPFVARFHFPTL